MRGRRSTFARPLAYPRCQFGSYLGELIDEHPESMRTIATKLGIPPHGQERSNEDRSGQVRTGPNEGPQPDPFGDPVFNDLLDDCLGHTAEDGAYHYHAMLAACATEGIIGRTDASPVIGYANDGFPIYGPFGCSDADCSKVIEYKSAWKRTGNPSTFAWDNHKYVARKQDKYLDQCNGHEGPQSDYHYHATEDFPYILGCYSGSADPGAAPPSKLRAKTRSNQRVLLRWKDTAKSETGYRVEMAAGDGDFEAVTETGKNVKKYLVEDLEAGETYTFRVRALSNAGVSNPSSAVSATAK